MAAPIIFVHGISASARVWQKFEVPDHQAFYISFKKNNANPAEQVPELDDLIRDVIKRTGQPKVILVCHSMGGLVARRYLADHRADHHVERLIILSTPNLGTPMLSFNWLPFSAAAWALRPGSRFLKGLNSKALPNDVKYISVLSNATTLPHRLANLLLFRESGDGAIPLSSQRLSPACVPNFAALDYSELKIDLPHFEIPKNCREIVSQALAV